MKDPSLLHWAAFDDSERCAEDGKKWPCKTWRKWVKSKDYRLALLESQVERLGLSNAGLRREGDNLRQRLSELEMVVNGGLMHAVGDLIGPPASLSVSRTVDMLDTSEGYSGHVVRVPGRTQFDVEYVSKGGAVWRNNKLVEQVINGDSS